jgi:ABC-2 type transport system ATP-binding protein
MGRAGLRLAGLQHRFGGLTVLDGVGFDIAPGEIVGLVGRNGAGKTTTMRILMGILTAQAGSVSWDGQAVDATLRRRFGYMPEERGLYPQMGLLEQVAYFARLHGIAQRDAEGRAGDWLGRLGLGDRTDDHVDALSHGNQQRVQLAVALMHEPVLLVLDEPFAGLDPAAVDVLAEVIAQQAAAGAAVLFSSHQLELVERICRRVVIIERGHVLADGTLVQLRERLPAQLRVKVQTTGEMTAAGGGDADYAWADALPGARVSAYDPDLGVLLVVEPGADLQAILHAAQAAGPVEHFGFESAGLIDLYRDLIA